MKKLFFAFGMLALMATSCSTVRKTATSIDVQSDVTSHNTAELNISSKRASTTFKPTKKESRGGRENVYRCATAALLEENGNADVLVQPQYTVRIRKGRIKEITISGYPAKYVNMNK